MTSPSFAAKETKYSAMTPKSSNFPPGNILQRFFKQFWSLVVVWAYLLVCETIREFFNKAPVIKIEELEKRSNHVAVMTGEPRGIGFHIVKKLLQLDYTVILGVPNMSASENAINEIRKLGITSGRVKLFDLNLKSLKSVRQFAEQVLASKESIRIDLLMNNAGIINISYEMTEDNYESIFQVNYLGHFLLTNLLLPRMKETAAQTNEPCQIIYTSSIAQREGRLDFDELETSKVFCPLQCYSDSKLCTVMHVKTLEKLFRQEETNIHAYAMHPGVIATDIWKDYGIIGRLIHPILKSICRTPDEAATTVLYPVLNPDAKYKCGGQYFESGKVILANKQANLPNFQKKLWERSLKLTHDSI